MFSFLHAYGFFLYIKSLLNLFQYCSCFYVFGFFGHEVCGISGSLTGDWNSTLCTGPPVLKFLSYILKIGISNEGKTWRGDQVGKGRERGIYFLLSIAESYSLRSIKLLWSQQSDHLVSQGILASGQGVWGKLASQAGVSELSSVPATHSITPTLSLLSYTLGSHCLTDIFWKKKKFLRAFWHPFLLWWLQPTEVFKWKHWNILQRPKRPGRKYDPMKGPAYWIKSIGSGVR